MAGDSLSVADLYFVYSVPMACAVAQKLFDIDLLAEMPAAKALLKRLEQNPHVQRIAKDKDAAMPAFLEMIASKKSRRVTILRMPSRASLAPTRTNTVFVGASGAAIRLAREAF